MLVDTQRAVSGDEMQADYFRDFLEEQRSELMADLALYTRRLTECMTAGDMGMVSHVRRAIRVAEGDLRVIDRMVEALNGRFPDECEVRRRAQLVRF